MRNVKDKVAPPSAAPPRIQPIASCCRESAAKRATTTKTATSGYCRAQIFCVLEAVLLKLLRRCSPVNPSPTGERPALPHRSMPAKSNLFAKSHPPQAPTAGCCPPSKMSFPAKIASLVPNPCNCAQCLRSCVAVGITQHGHHSLGHSLVAGAVDWDLQKVQDEAYQREYKRQQSEQQQQASAQSSRGPVCGVAIEMVAILFAAFAGFPPFFLCPSVM